MEATFLLLVSCDKIDISQDCPNLTRNDTVEILACSRIATTERTIKAWDQFVRLGSVARAIAMLGAALASR
jgi:hypothetical protein